MTNGNQGRVYFGWVVLSLAFLIGFFSAGINQGFGVFIKPMIDDFGWSRAEISLSVSIFAIVSAIVPPVAGRISDRYGPRMVLTIGVALNALGMVLMATAGSLVEIYLFYGGLIGAGFGFTGIAAITALLSRWFVRRRGLAFGVAAAGLGAGQFLLAPAMTFMVIQFSWQTAFVVVGASSAVLVPAVFLLLKRDAPPGADEYAADLPDEPVPQDAVTNDMIRADMDVAWGSRSFWMLAGGLMACGFTVSFLMAHLVPLAIDSGISAEQAGVALGRTGGTSIIANLGIAAIADRISRRYILAGLYALRGVSVLLLFSLSGVAMLYTAALLFGLSRANVPVVSAAIVDHFGRRAVGSLVGTLFMYHQLFAAAGVFLGGLVYDRFGGYDIMLTLTLFSMIAATVVSLLAADPAGTDEGVQLAQPVPSRLSAD